jgi:hypothetical protein
LTGQQSLRHEFVEFIPDQLEEGVLYVSIEHATAAHKCACGCRNEVFTPLSRTDWKLIFDGETVSLNPSIGNWSFDCQSHYWIEEGRVRWAPRWSRDKIEDGRELDRLAKAGRVPVDIPRASVVEQPPPKTGRARWLRQLLGRART